jgi:hypothetical protein
MRMRMGVQDASTLAQSPRRALLPRASVLSLQAEQAYGGEADATDEEGERRPRPIPKEGDPPRHEPSRGMARAVARWGLLREPREGHRNPRHPRGYGRQSAQISR